MASAKKQKNPSKGRSVPNAGGATRSTALPVSEALLGIALFATVVPAMGTLSTYWSRSIALFAIAAVMLPVMLWQRRIPHPWVLVSVSAFAAAASLATVWGVAPFLSLWSGVSAVGSLPFWIAGAVCILFGASLAFTNRLRAAVAIGMSWAPVASVVAVVERLNADRVLAGFVNENFLAVALVGAAFVYVGFALSARSTSQKVAGAAAGAACLAGLVAAGSLAGFAALLVGALSLVGGYMRSNRRAGLLSAAFQFGPLASSAIVVLAAALGAGSGLVERLGGTAVTRQEMWIGSIGAVAARPLLGFGPGVFGPAAQSHVPRALFGLEFYASPLEAFPVDPHSLVLTSLVSFGVVGALALVAVGVVVGARSWLDAPEAQAGLFAAGLTASAVASVAALLFVPFSPANGGVAALLVGCSVATSSRRLEFGRALSRVASIGLAVIVCCYLLAASWVFAMSGSAQGLLDKATDRNAFLAGAAAAQKAEPNGFTAAYLNLWTPGAMAETDQQIGAWHTQIDGTTSFASSYAPFLTEFVRISLDQAERSGRTDLAWERAALDRSARLSPGYPLTDLERARLLAMSGNSTEAQRVLASVESWRAYLPERYARYQQLISQSGR